MASGISLNQLDDLLLRGLFAIHKETCGQLVMSRELAEVVYLRHYFCSYYELRCNKRAR